MNISEGGLSFSTFAPVEQTGPIHFWFSLNLSERIDAWGEVAWTDEMKKVGGLRFIRLPERAGRQIREWISGPISPHVDGRFATLEESARPFQARANKPDAVARFVSKARAEQFPVTVSSILAIGENSESSTVPLAPLEDAEASGELVPIQRYLSEKRRQFRLGLLLGICTSVALAVPVMKYWSYWQANPGFGKTPVELPAQTSGSALPPAPITATTPSSASPDIPRGGNQNSGIAKGRAPSISGTETGGHSSLYAPRASAASPSAKAPLDASLNGNASRQKPAMTPQQLWASVQAGNSKAAVTLAELYIKGDGVPQNCNQARVLLLVASEKKNADAIKRLHELDKTDCP
ncbi:MAG TPA: PilZ domain-containing protein [Candidatus Acidoferrum sp.]|nr:PilZ domain-containing protein [Candidatus Acidoferrum sp.]